MSALGFVMLAHTALHRAAQVTRHLAVSGCPLIIHVDRRVAKQEFIAFRDELSDLPDVQFTSRRRRCEWGTWGIVGATIGATEELLNAHRGLGHICLISGACLPLRPVPELLSYLADRPDTDFIESVTIDDVGWSKGGFDHDRFAYRFPFSFKRRRAVFDAYTDLQRRFGLRRRMPEGLVPHLGSQWWCLSRRTLAAILSDPDRPSYEGYFRQVWIPDESYFQSLVRLHGRRIESRSLTLSKFDFQGKPHIFYDDHLQLLRRSDCFLARKIWPRAERLYSAFLSNDPGVTKNAEPNPGKIDRLFSRAVERRVQGRAGLLMQSRFPAASYDVAKTAEPYSVFAGFSDLFEDFEPWLSKASGYRVHGHLYAPGRAEFAGRVRVFNGCLCDSASLRDYNPRSFLTSLIWATRGERQCFQFGPADHQEALPFIAGDPNAQVSIIAGGWAVRLFAAEARSELTGDALRREAARLQKIEMECLDLMRASWVKARVRIWSLAEFMDSPMENLTPILDEISPRSPRRPTEAPRLVDLGGFGRFLQRLKNDGMNLHLAGDFPTGPEPVEQSSLAQRPYLVK